MYNTVWMVRKSGTKCSLIKKVVDFAWKMTYVVGMNKEEKKQRSVTMRKKDEDLLVEISYGSKIWKGKLSKGIEMVCDMLRALKN